MRIAILYNAISPDANEADQDVLVQVEAVAQSLGRLGHETDIVPITLDLESLVARLARPRPELVFNLVESLGGSDRLAPLATAVLDTLGIAYTGSPTGALFLTGDKPAAKSQMCQAGLPTPDWMTTDAGQPSRLQQTMGNAARGRFIIKPIWEHASLGMNAGAVVEVADAAELAARLAERTAATGRPSFAERFVDGREFNLSVLASPARPEVLPPAEIDFSAFAPGMTRIVDYEAKWDDRSFAYHNTPRTFDFDAADGPLLDELAELARACWEVFDLAGYARVDFRLDSNRRPWILEINANPCLAPDAGFAAAVERAGIGFDQAVERIVADALRHVPAPPLAHV